ncbi:hypothetical protein ASD97_25970 [Streptomyces sp. Root63]|uniref:hypothetical protein n=1 Tax=unclassified Streptomyces TaxID=2593676 RepID=UPI0006FC5B11|nr:MULTISPECIES: hypothetical protein [unclassified Streptomyces]KQX43523.1 hypothetical protein ASD29_32275 [Streptomyces sp. Root1295]KRA34086.1 hypothetical protein ASD97_25970 [Streptomyces sp. Root63]
MSLYEYGDLCNRFLGVYRVEGHGDDGDQVMIHQSDEYGLINTDLPPAEIHKLIKALQKVVGE